MWFKRREWAMQKEKKYIYGHMKVQIKKMMCT
jgi:uncharacterized membrane protein YjgN (DUF898 family)